MSDLFEIKAELPFSDVDSVDEQLLELGEPLWSVFQDILMQTAWVVGIFEGASEAQAAWDRLRPLVPGASDAVVRALAPADWRDSYKAHFRAWRCGRLHWVPIWEKESYALPAGEVALWLDPGLAFGTGNHETTRLCCEYLVAWAERAASNARIVDAGCGSGILALSAARLGFTDVRGFDNDPEAVRVSEENAVLNALGGRVRFETADLISGLADTQADLVLANIQADVLMQFAQPLLAAVAPGGSLCLSGILARERATVEESFRALAPDWRIDTRDLGEWSAVHLERPTA